MSRDELMKLFDLLDSLCSAGRRAPRDRRGVLAWELALKPYAYEDMKRAALEHAREKAFFPDICELVSRVPKEREEPENGGERGLSVQTVGGRILAGYESSGGADLYAGPRAWHELFAVVGAVPEQGRVAALEIFDKKSKKIVKFLL